MGDTVFITKWESFLEAFIDYILPFSQAQHLLMNFEEPLKDYVRAVQSIKVIFCPLAFRILSSIDDCVEELSFSNQALL